MEIIHGIDSGSIRTQVSVSIPSSSGSYVPVWVLVGCLDISVVHMTAGGRITMPKLHLKVKKKPVKLYDTVQSYKFRRSGGDVFFIPQIFLPCQNVVNLVRIVALVT